MLKLWKAETGEFVRDLVQHEGPVTFLGWSFDGARMVTCSADATAVAWDTTTWEPVARMKGHAGTVNSAAFNREGTQVLTAGVDGTARTWDAATGRAVATLRSSGEVVGGAFTPNGDRAIVASSSDGTWIWDVASGSRLLRIGNARRPVYDYRNDRLLCGNRYLTAAPWEVSRLPGDAATTWQERFALYKDAERAKVLAEQPPTGRGPVIETRLISIDDIDECLEILREIEADASKNPADLNLDLKKGPKIPSGRIQGAYNGLGLFPTDVILAIDGVAIANLDDSLAPLARYRAAWAGEGKEPLAIELQRTGKRRLMHYNVRDVKHESCERTIPKALANLLLTKVLERLESDLDISRSALEADPGLNLCNLSAEYLFAVGLLGFAKDDVIKKFHGRPLTTYPRLRERGQEGVG